MLIIERRAGQLIQIGDEIELHVLDSDGEIVRLGVSAPRDIAVRAVEPVVSEPPLAEREPATQHVAEDKHKPEDKR